jgi:ribose/xylose/arabinose/galactoside ABC-type transport system permease subunit
LSGEGIEQSKRNRWETLNQYRGLFAFVFVFILGCFFTPRVGGTGLPLILSWRTQLDILYEYCEYGLLAIGMTLVILTSGIDLSVGSVLGCAATLFAILTIGFGWGSAEPIFPPFHPVPAHLPSLLEPLRPMLAAPWPVLKLLCTGWVGMGSALVVVMLFGLAAGTLNGTLISRFRLQPFVVTLALMTGLRGLAKWISGSIKVQPAAQPWYVLQGDTPPFFHWMSQGLPGIGVKPAVLLFLISLLIMAIVVSRTSYGRKLYSIGGNELAANLSGIAVNRIKVLTYALCGLFAALAGVVNTTRQDIGDPEAGATFELNAIAAVVIGGTSLAGGEGNMGFTLIGVLIIAYINKILSLRGIDEASRLMIQAGIILIAVLIQRRKRR